MKTLQIHADYMMYEPLRREGSVYEEVDPSVREFRDIVVEPLSWLISSDISVVGF
jgi:hypothetical protein